MTTRVVNISKGMDYNVYIGRAVGHSSLPGYFGNPFQMQNSSSQERERVIRNYTYYFVGRILRDPEFKQRVLELKDKTLGCYCAPRHCHGHVIAAWLDGELVI